MKNSSCRPFVLLVVATAVGTWSRAAGAYEEQWHFGAGLGVASFPRVDGGLAPALGAHGVYDISDMFDARVELTASEHEFVPGRTTRLYSVAAGLAYKLDVQEWVPYAGIMGGYYAFSAEPWPAPLEETELGLSIPLGLDYTFSPSFGMGAQLRYHGFVSEPLGGIGDAPYFTALLRAELRLGR